MKIDGVVIVDSAVPVVDDFFEVASSHGCRFWLRKP
jgi:hypothetical protein